MRTNTDARWFEQIDGDAVAHYITDELSEVYAMRADAEYFVRVREDDGAYYLTLLTNDQAELIAGTATLSMPPDSIVAATILAMLS